VEKTVKIKKVKTIIITGASRGIGAATAILAAREGYVVIVNYLKSQKAAESIVTQIRNSDGVAMAIQADISNQQDVENLFIRTKQQFGKIDVLINNAGILEKQMSFEQMNIERIKEVFNTNTFGQFICSKEAIKYMAKSKGGQGGVIINVSSLAAITGAPNEYIDYAASKGAIDSFTIGLSKEIANEGIRVNAVRPAFIHTDIHSAGGEPGRIDRIKNAIPLKRGGKPEEVAEAILWLASDKASYCTGTFIDINGGK
jgi:NAD(P)-dependent dehydrogenase (short-subunit alcohol dehydrogenase family)